jgi:hypothetical protein
MVADCAAVGVPVVLQTYAAQRNNTFLAVNAGARQAADRAAVPLIDHAELFSADGSLEPFKTFQRDGHPTRFGYHHMALFVEAFLKDYPPFEGWPFDEAATAPPTAPLEPLAIGGPELLDGEPGIRFRLHGPPFKPWRLLLARGTTAPVDGIALAADDLFEQALSTPFGLTGSFDADGEAEARVYSPLCTAFAGQAGFAQLVRLPLDGAPRPADTAPPVRFRFP